MKKKQKRKKDGVEIPLDELDSPTLKRLVEEVREEKRRAPGQGYDRIHNRHNRGGL